MAVSPVHHRRHGQTRGFANQCFRGVVRVLVHSPFVWICRYESRFPMIDVQPIVLRTTKSQARTTSLRTIIERKRADGTPSFRAQIVIKEGGRAIHQESRSFDRHTTAAAWMKRREKELRAPGGLKVAKSNAATLSDAFTAYVEDHKRKIGKTKAQVLRSIGGHDIATMRCDEIKSDDIVAWARWLLTERGASTVGNYLSHLSAVAVVAEPAWGMPLDHKEFRKARAVTLRLGLTAKSNKRDRRPTLAELDRLMTHFHETWMRGRSMPMHRVVAFAIFSTRRQDEICRIAWADYEPDHQRVLVRDMKHPGEKIGNDVWCEVPPRAAHVMEAQRGAEEARIFPYTADAISAAFSRACKLLGIEDLRFHDLRHEGVSCLFEQGRTVPLAASVSGHRSWGSLQRYSHIRKTGDRFDGWPWIDRIGRDA
ncbi:tyrosine-type recombinase/integrase [Mangrovicoccus ximenensis]|uniref:tyrosine-type recombinase/integrase n=1 Tax=Mangrovicoccus ximenensis TaxID=1911570 RepID=UPI002ED375A4